MAKVLHLRGRGQGLLLLAAVTVATLLQSHAFVGGSHSQRQSIAVGKSRTALAAEDNARPLMAAAHLNDLPKVKQLVADGEHINAQDAYGWTALRYATRGKNMEAAEFLIATGADVNIASSSGRTPLMSAAGNGFSAMIRLLLKNGADRHAKDQNGQTAYDLAMRGGSTGCTACREMLATGEHEVPEIKIDM
mmetsp:Transcript_37433/g.67656  ORF Transcript_37433/g.67656 Transcript_37433/m.67656 type:complete len:192 (-) Transcript_37433:221-796(-)|eukprot:CAMPEP_0197657800 /NCGR_PEP_ID=MMETSP1338-20131121/44856_1 /TAXON_ID=43686 ORGANISM="Pelagodinium beii, Strain RCC1491" /NCGR_SAMPLE_ID=MMETSP1338 /ASSEMBLY_ACC=CAM_ASM_000754 /LENGTH=191 /DNA_ID=CAMNT_0043234257 /DNA_START=97 /DNA_END=672 /DNA_ORIENTATION=-